VLNLGYTQVFVEFRNIEFLNLRVVYCPPRRLGLEEFEYMEKKITHILEENGPLTGAQLTALLPEFTDIAIWRQCYSSDSIRVSNCARYYLRYDITRGNQLRLSPSILRDFLTFSLIYSTDQMVEIVEKGTRLANQFRAISMEKLHMARRALLDLDDDLQEVLNKHCVVFLSGDIAYYLAHKTPRRHNQLGVEILGSDIDIVIISNREAPADQIEKIENQLLKIKKVFLMSPEIREELDFIVKPIEKMIEQLSYRDIHEKIASKILYESYFLMGRVDIYQALINHLEAAGTRDMIERDFEIALGQRKETIATILKLPPDASTDDEQVASLFFASKERLEFS